MSDAVRLETKGGVAHVTLARPPENTLDEEMLAAIGAAFDRIAADPEVGAVVLAGEGPVFSAGADIRALDRPEAGPGLSALCARVELCPRPVVAAVQGTAPGAAGSLALAAHVRVFGAAAGLVFPEVGLGTVPGGGATQRLPRLVGAEAALDLMLSGRRIDAAAARRMGLADAVAGGDARAEAASVAATLAARGRAPRAVRGRRDGMADGPGYAGAVRRRRESVARSALVAPGKIVDCVEAAQLLPFEAGLDFEAAAIEDCLAGPQFTALRHLFLAERRISPRFLETAGGRRTVAAPAGLAAVTRLQRAFDRAAAALAAGGVPETVIDGGLVDQGFARTPFGGGTGGAGEDGRAAARRIVAALMAEGARLVERRALERPADADVLAVYGLGFPRRAGGPMRAAQTMGLLGLRRQMEAWAREDPVWSPPALLSEAAKYAGGFDVVSVAEAA